MSPVCAFLRRVCWHVAITATSFIVDGQFDVNVILPTRTVGSAISLSICELAAGLLSADAMLLSRSGTALPPGPPCFNCAGYNFDRWSLSSRFLCSRFSAFFSAPRCCPRPCSCDLICTAGSTSHSSGRGTEARVFARPGSGDSFLWANLPAVILLRWIPRLVGL